MEIRAIDCTIKAVEHVNEESTSQTVPIFELPPGAFVIACGGRVKTAFAGVTFPTVQVGTSDDTDSHVVDQPINKVGDLIPGAVHNSIDYCEKIPAGGMVKTEVNKSIVATFTSVSGNLSSLTAGEIEFFLVYVD